MCRVTTPEEPGSCVSIYLRIAVKNHWENLDEFCPARFDRSSEDKQPPFTYVPWRRTAQSVSAQLLPRLRPGRHLAFSQNFDRVAQR